MKRALVLAAFLACGLAALEASAANPGGHGGYERHGMQGSEGHQDWNGARQARLESLNLSESQRDKIAKIRESHQKDRIQSEADLKTAQLEFRKLMREDRPDKRAIDSQIDRMASIRADMIKSRVDQQLEVRDVLTPDQRAKLHEGHDKRGQKDDEAPPRDQDPRRP